METKKKSLYKKTRRILFRTFLFLILIFVALVLLIRSPWGQDKIINQVTHYVSSKTSTPFNIEKFFLTFDGNLNIQGFSLKDQQEKTLVYFEELELNIPLFTIFKEQKIHLKNIELKGLESTVYRLKNKDFNYQFLIDAFASSDEKEEENDSEFDFFIGRINLKNGQLTYLDEEEALEAEVVLGHLLVQMKTFDLKNLNFEIDEFLILQSDFKYTQKQTENKLIETDEQKDDLATDGPDLNLKINDFSLVELATEINYYEDDYTAFLEQFNWKDLELDLKEKQLTWKLLNIEESKVDLDLAQKEVSKNSANKAEDFVVEWPAWEIAFEQLSVKNQKFTQTTKGEKLNKNTFDASPVEFNQLHLDLSDLSYLPSEKNLKLKLKQFQFEEHTGLALKNLNFNLQVNQQAIDFDQLQLNTLQNQLKGNARIQFTSLTNFINYPEEFTDLHLDVAGNFQLKEFKPFLPNFKQNEALVNLAKHPIQTKIKANGKKGNINLQPSFVHWNTTKINFAGTLHNLMKANQSLTLDTYYLSTKKEDLLLWLPTERIAQIDLPDGISLTGSLTNKQNLWTTKSSLKSDFGSVNLEGKIDLDQEISFDFSTNASDLALAKILQNKDLSPLNMHFNVKGKYKDLSNIDVDFNSEITKLTAFNQNFDGLQLSLQLKESKGDLSLNFENENIDLNLHSPVELADNFYVFQPKLEVKGVDFYSLGWLKEDIRARFIVDAAFSGNPEEFDFSLSIPEFVSVYEKKSYRLRGFDIEAQIGTNKTNLQTKSKFLNSQLKANKHPRDLVDASLKYLQKYLTDFKVEENESEGAEVDLEWDVQLTNIPLLSEVYLEDLDKMDTLKLSLDFKEEKNEIRINSTLPELIYKDIQLNDLAITANANPQKADFSIGFESLENAGFKLAKTQLFGNYEDHAWKVAFEAYQDDEAFFLIRSFIEKDKNLWRFSLDQKQLILNRQQWKVHPKNYIKFGNRSIAIKDFQLEHKQQKLSIQNDLEIPEEHVAVLFKDFKLATLSSYFHPDALFANGDINGSLAVVKPYEQMGFLADLNIDNLAIKNQHLGKFELNASANGNNTYKTKIQLKGAQIDFFAEGKYFYEKQEPKLAISAQLKKLNLDLIAFYLPELIDEAEGEIRSDFELKGSTNKLSYAGNLQMKEIGFRAKPVNTKFYFGEEFIQFNQNEIEFKNFTIADAQKNKFNTSGKVFIENPSNPIFNLNFKAENFQLLDAKRNETTAYFGQANFDLNAQLTGNLNVPVVNLDFTLNKSSNISYIIPEAQADVVDREGVVLFVNKSNPNDILTRATEKEFNDLIKGFEIDAKIKVDPEAKITVIFNPRTGDQIQLQGNADLLAQVKRNGNIDLSGTYEVKQGFFEINLYNLVTRRFRLAEGSKVSWYGDPYNADLDIRAVYQIETSPSALMASQLASEASSIKNQYRRLLPFLVYLDVDGNLSAPLLNFALDMPEDQRAAINGTVYTRINQLNQQEDERNKQVFSLLVLNRFYPELGSDGSQGGAATLARNNLNQALADQLNAFSNKLIGNTGIQLNFDINSYTDFETGVGQERTDLDVSAQKKLFNDRLVVEAGSQVNVQGEQRPGESNVAVGNVSVEYLITQDGRWKARGFRKSEYENVIDGQVFISGIALIFTREFNEFNELWKSLFNSTETLEEEEKEKKELEETEKKKKQSEENKKTKSQARIENEN